MYLFLSFAGCMQHKRCNPEVSVSTIENLISMPQNEGLQHIKQSICGLNKGNV